MLSGLLLAYTDREDHVTMKLIGEDLQIDDIRYPINTLYEGFIYIYICVGQVDMCPRSQDTAYQDRVEVVIMIILSSQ